MPQLIFLRRQGRFCWSRPLFCSLFSADGKDLPDSLGGVGQQGGKAALHGAEQQHQRLCDKPAGVLIQAFEGFQDAARVFKKSGR